MLTRFYAPLSKIEKQDDGTLKISGIASTEAIDSDGEIIKASAIKAALPDFFKHGTGALREMHQPRAAGTVDDAETEDNVTRIAATVVDAEAIRKIEKGVYKGLSIGGKVFERDKDNRKVITKIGLYEISLVDRPANPEATLDVWKVDGYDTDVVTEADAVDLSGLPDLGAAVCKAALSHFEKRDFSASQRKEDAKSGAAMKDGSFPIHNAEDLHNAIRLAGNAKNPGAARAHIKSRAAALGLSADIPSTWKAVMTDPSADAEKLAKAAEAEALAKAAAENAEAAAKADAEKAKSLAKAEKDAAEALAKAAAEAVVNKEVDAPAAVVNEDVDPVAKAAAAVDALEALAKPDTEKSMYDVAFHAQRLADLARHIEHRDPESGVTDRMKAWSKEGGAILKDMTAEEVASMNAKVAKKAAEAADLAKAAAKVESDEALAKVVSENADLKKSFADLAGRMNTAVEALTKRLAEVPAMIEQAGLSPLPAKTAGPGAASVIEKHVDAAGGASAVVAAGGDPESIKKYLDTLSPDERAMVLMKASHQLPMAISYR